MTYREMNIGIFDSGLGGLSILKDIITLLPQYNYVYLGDNARVPYGNRSSEVIYGFTCQAVDFLFKNDCQLIILACNSATASALRKIQQIYLPAKFPGRRVLGVIRPTTEKVCEDGKSRVGVIGTRATVNSNCFTIEINKLNSEIEVYQQSCPLFVPLIEEGESDSGIMKLTIKKYLNVLMKNRIESLILGCTHYGLIKEQIETIAGDSIEVISEGPVVAASLDSYIKRHSEIENKLTRNGERHYFVTDLTVHYEEMARMFLGDHFSPEAKLQLATLG